VLADESLCALAASFPAPRILEVGVSDGSSSLGLLRRGQEFSALLLTDRHNLYYRRRCALGSLYYDSDRHLLCCKLGIFYFDLSSLNLLGGQNLQPMETVNPVLRESFGIAGSARLDVFCDTVEPAVQVIKCSNLLNSSYFTREDIHRAASNLSRSLVEGGYFVVSQNNATMYREAEAFSVLRKQNGSFILVQSVNNHDAAEMFQAPLDLRSESFLAKHDPEERP